MVKRLSACDETGSDALLAFTLIFKRTEQPKRRKAAEGRIGMAMMQSLIMMQQLVGVEANVIMSTIALQKVGASNSTVLFNSCPYPSHAD